MITVPINFNGRVWGRTGCDGSSPASCATGQCGGSGLQCAGTTGQAGTSLAEFNLNAAGTDWYNVSYVDGFDNPIGVCVLNGSCVSPEHLQHGAAHELQRRPALGRLLPEPVHEVQHGPVLLPRCVRDSADLQRVAMVRVRPELREQHPLRVPAPIRVRLRRHRRPAHLSDRLELHDHVLPGRTAGAGAAVAAAVAAESRRPPGTPSSTRATASASTTTPGARRTARR